MVFCLSTVHPHLHTRLRNWTSTNSNLVTMSLKQSLVGAFSRLKTTVGGSSTSTREEEQPSQQEVYQQPNPPTAVPDGHVRFVCISDTHARAEKQSEEGLVVPDGDVLLHAGDFTNVGSAKDVQLFSDWLGRQTHKHKIVIAGNHETTFHPEFYEENWSRFHKTKGDPQKIKAMLKNCTYLEDESCEVEGFKIYGSPWSPEFCNWAFNVDRGEPSKVVWKKIPTETDILITHGPPLGHGDLCYNGFRAGCPELLEEIKSRVKPLLHVFGHIHEAYGVTTDEECGTIYANASTCTFNYKPDQKALVFDLPRPN